MKPSYQFWKLSLGILLVSLAVVVITLYTARLSNQAMCMKWMTTDSRAIRRQPAIADILHPRALNDYRQPLMSDLVGSPDHKFTLGYQARNSRTQAGDLVLRTGLSRSGADDVTVVQPNISTNYMDYTQYRQLLWAPDSRRFAYLWNDESHLFIAVATVDGTQRGSAVVIDDPAILRQTSVMMGGWSEDGNYFFIGRGDKNARNTRYELWDAKALRPVGSADFITGAWSPQGHQFAGVRNVTADQYAFVLWSPAGEIIKPIVMEHTDHPLQLSWSPRDEYIVLHSSQVCANSKVCSHQWRYDLWDSAGDPVVEKLAGNEIPESLEQNDRTVAPANMAWTADEQMMVFVQIGARDDNKDVLDLVALHLPEMTYETLETDLVEGLVNSLFYADWTKDIRLAKTAITTNNRMLIVSRHDEKIKVQLATLDGKDRLTLVDGAGRLLTSNQYTFNPFWSEYGTFIVVPWFSDSKRSRTPPVDAHLTWIRSDGTGGLHEIDGLSDVQVPRIVWSGVDNKNIPQKLGYITRYGDGNNQYALEMVALDGSHRVRVLDNLSSNTRWAAELSPVDNLMALETGFEISYLINTVIQSPIALYLVSANGDHVKPIDSNAAGIMQWSPDGKHVGYLNYDPSSKKVYLKIITADGNLVSRQEIKVNVRAYEQVELWGWSNCE